MKHTKLYIDRHMIVSKVDKRIYGSFIEHLGRAVYEGIYQPGQKTAPAVLCCYFFRHPVDAYFVIC